MKRIAILTGLLWAGPLLAQTALLCGQLLDPEDGELKRQQVVTISQGRIQAIDDGTQAPSGHESVDLSRHTCLPGLIDLHTHLSSEQGPTYYLDRFRLNEADVAFRATEYARRTLDAGFTTVRDLGDRYRVSIALRDAINAGWTVGPRIFAAGKSIATTGGHADPTSGWRHDLAGDPGPAEGVINGVSDARKAVRQRYKDGSDLIKITATGGVLSTARNSQNPQFTEEELRIIVETARDYGFHVAAHAHGAEGMKRAIRAGVRSIEHGTYMDDEIFRLMKKHDTWFVPTLMAGDWVARKSEIDGFFPEVVRPKAAEIGPKMAETFRRALEAGVPIAFGTDSGVSRHGDNAREFELMVAQGMQPLEALRSATVNAAQVLEQPGELGSLRPGAVADIIAVPGNPLMDITRMQQVEFVMKDGGIVRAP